MLLTKENLDECMFENHDAKLLIEDIVTRTEASVYYYGTEISLSTALKLWNKADKAENGIKVPIRRYQASQNRRVWLLHGQGQSC